MVLRMTRATKRPESSFLTFRKRVPSDILAKAKGHSVTIQFPAEGTHEAATVIAKIGSEIKFSLCTREPSIAKSRTGVAEAHLQRTWEALRSGPRKLTHKQVVALAGKLYEVFALTLEDDPGEAATWQKVIRPGSQSNRMGIRISPRLMRWRIRLSISAAWQRNSKCRSSPSSKASIICCRLASSLCKACS